VRLGRRATSQFRCRVTARGREWREAVGDGLVSAMRCTFKPQLHASLGGGKRLPGNRGQLGRCAAPARVERRTIGALDWSNGVQGKSRDGSLIYRILEKSFGIGIPCVLVGPEMVVRVQLVAGFVGIDDDGSGGDSRGKGASHFFLDKKKMVKMKERKEGERFEEKRE